MVEEFEIESDETGGALAPDFNVAPTKVAPVVLSRVPRDRRHEDAVEPVRQLRLLTWGLVPSWSKSADGSAKMINARLESLFHKPAYKRAAATRRAIVPADGWYEWAPVQGAGARQPKQPFYISRADGDPVALAGIYEFWRNPHADDDDPNAWLTTFAVVTQTAEPTLQHIHERMPVVLDRSQWSAWLDPNLTDEDQVRDLVAVSADGRFSAVPVSRLVSNTANNGPELVQPAEAGVDALTGEITNPLF